MAHRNSPSNVKKGLLSVVGPGILVAATGIGAGDLATAAFTGTKLGVAILWAVVLGAFFKFVLNEGLTRWQLATGTTLLEGAVSHLGRPARYGFLVYLLAWSFMVAAALMSACGAASHAILPLFQDPSTGKIVYGILLSVAGVVLVRLGGYRLFERVMSACIGFMFVTVVATAVVLEPKWSDLMAGLLIPTIPDLHGGGLAWTVALMGGVGGTVTVLCYGYWIREEGRFRDDDLHVCRLDLAVAYVMTALFGLAMVVVGSTIEVEGGGAALRVGFASMQKCYAIVGALFMPILAFVLLILNGRAKWVGERHRNRPLTSVLLIIVLLFFLMAGWLAIRRTLGL